MGNVNRLFQWKYRDCKPGKNVPNYMLLKLDTSLASCYRMFESQSIEKNFTLQTLGERKLM